MTEPDSLQHFIFTKANIRGEIAHLTHTYQTIISQRSYPPMVKHLLGEALISCLLLVGSIKFTGSLSLQFQGDKNLPLILVQCDDQLNLRGYASFQEDLTTEDYAQAFLKGQMALMISQDNKAQTYQSLVPIHSTALSENLMYYFGQSEQIATRVWLALDENRAAGMLLQLMPGEEISEREQFWEYAVQLGETVSEHELLTLDNQTLLTRLYHETELKIFPEKTARFTCRCTHEKMKRVVVALGEQEAKQLLNERGHVEIRCELCNNSYQFDRIDITLLFR